MEEIIKKEGTAKTFIIRKTEEKEVVFDTIYVDREIAYCAEEEARLMKELDKIRLKKEKYIAVRKEVSAIEKQEKIDKQP